MSGLPRSGKTTLARAIALEINAPIISLDAIRESLFDGGYIRRAEPFVRGVAEVMANSLMMSGTEVVIIDCCNITYAARERWRVAMIARCNWVVVSLPTTADECSQRCKCTSSNHLIPVIRAMDSQRDEFLPSEGTLHVVNGDVVTLSIGDESCPIGKLLRKLPLT